MNRSERIVFIAALGLGAALYVTTRAPILMLHAGMAESLAAVTIDVPGWVSGSLPFAAWCFAFTFALRRHPSAWAVGAIAIGAELGQLLGWIPGTFDPTDLVALCLAWGAGIAWPTEPDQARRKAPSLAPQAALLVGFAVLTTATSESPEHKAEREAKEKKNLEGLDTYMAKLAEIHDSLAKVDLDALQPKACDQAAMLEAPAVEHGFLNLRTISLDFLARFGKPADAWTKSEGDWAFIDDGGFAGHFAEHPEKRTAYAVKDTALRVQETYLAERYLIVIAPYGDDTKIAPVMKSDSFDGGYFEGWMLVVDQRDGTIACQGPLLVESSKSIDFGGRFDGKDPTKEMHEDFEDNFEKAITANLPPKIKLSTSYGSLLF